MTKHEALHEHAAEVVDQPLNDFLLRREIEAVARAALQAKRSAAAKRGWETRRARDDEFAMVMSSCDCTGDRSHFFFNP